MPARRNCSRQYGECQRLLSPSFLPTTISRDACWAESSRVGDHITNAAPSVASRTPKPRAIMPMPILLSRWRNTLTRMLRMRHTC